jgi:TPP-dependent pyruvate/acetoin dehydrogenase alpha subunit
LADVAGAREGKQEGRNDPDPAFDWRRIAYLVQLSRAMDRLEEEELVPARKILYQFSARGHDMAQIILGTQLTQKTDGVCGYYRSRPLLLSLGVPLEDALGSNMGRAGGYSDGRDIGVVFNFPNADGPSALPMSGGVGAQYTPTAGWAQAIEYHREVLKDPAYDHAIAVVLGGDASVATNGFWSALTIATTQKLPMLFYIEDNGYGISVPSSFQTPGGDIARNLGSFSGLEIIAGDGTEPAEAARLVAQAVDHVRSRRGPCLLRLKVPRLQGHSFQDTQAYKAADFVEEEWSRDPLPKLKAFLAGSVLDAGEWEAIGRDAEAEVERARQAAEARPVAEPVTVLRHVLFEGELQKEGGQWLHGYTPPESHDEAQPEGPRITMAAAIRRTLDQELPPPADVRGCAGQLLVERPPDRRGHGDARAFRLGLIVRLRRRVAVEPLPALLLQLAFEKDVAKHGHGLGHRPRFGRLPGALHLGLGVAADRLPLARVEHRPGKEGLQLGQRIAAPFLLDEVGRLIGLGVLEAVTLKARDLEPQQARAAARADVIDRLRHQPRRFGGLGAVAGDDLKPAEAAEVAGDVAAGGLEG